MPYPVLLNGQEYTHEYLLNSASNASSFTSFEKSVISFYQEWFSDQNEFEFQTSGTTGTPKKITFKRKHLIHSAQITLDTFDLTQGKQALLCLSPKYVAGKMMMVRAMAGELQLIAQEPSENPLLNQNNSIDFIAITPHQLFAILKNKNTRSKFEDIPKVIVGGGAVNGQLQQMLSSCTNDVYHTYAMTETLTHVAIRLISGRNPDILYSLLPGFEIDQDDRGCLMIKTPYSSDWIITNDVVEIMSPTSFSWKGRFDNVINTGGIKVIPEEIEPIIEDYFKWKGINNRFFLFGKDDTKLGQKIMLAIEGSLSSDKDKLIDKLKTICPPYKSPKGVILYDQFETTTSGKVNRLKTIEKS